jgi:anti-sigma-K factor RskA
MNDDELDALLAGHALGALDDHDRQLVDELVATDAAARDRLEEYERTAMMLAAELGPPDSVWDRIAQAAFPGQPRVPEPRRAQRLPRRPSRRFAGAAGLAAAACLAALVTGAVLVTRSGSSGSTDLTAAARTAQTAPDARRLTMHTPSGIAVGDVVVRASGAGYLRMHLGRLGAGHTYQLWAVGPGREVSLGVLGPDPRVVAFTLAGGAPTLAVTEERAGGVAATEQPPVAAAAMTP